MSTSRGGDLNGIHTNNCECRVGLLKWWLKKHRGVSKWYLESYVQSFQFVHNHRHYGVNGRFLAALAAILDPVPGAAGLIPGFPSRTMPIQS